MARVDDECVGPFSEPHSADDASIDLSEFGPRRADVAESPVRGSDRVVSRHSGTLELGHAIRKMELQLVVGIGDRIAPPKPEVSPPPRLRLFAERHDGSVIVRITRATAAT
jgi:hypothetical protein